MVNPLRPSLNDSDFAEFDDRPPLFAGVQQTLLRFVGQHAEH